MQSGVQPEGGCVIRGKRLSVPEDIWRRVKKTETCWIWTGGVNGSRKDRGDGYGRVRYQKRHRYVHVLTWEWANGTVPPGKELDHKCRTVLCVNPDHLEPVSHQTNCQRGLAGNYNKVKTHCQRGHLYDEEGTRWSRGKRYCKRCEHDIYKNYPLVKKDCDLCGAEFEYSSYSISRGRNRRYCSRKCGSKSRFVKAHE